MSVRMLLVSFLTLYAPLSTLCEKLPVAELIGRLSINGIIADDDSNLAGSTSSSYVSAPRFGNGHGNRNWTTSMPAPQKVLGKRAGEPAPRRYGPMWPQGNNCVFCPEPEMLEKDGLTMVRELTARKMKTYMRGLPTDYNNKCVFYTRAEDRLNALSSPATDWACLYNKYSIWHLWPNKRMAAANAGVNDFYGIYESDNWLYKIVELQQASPPRVGAPYPTRYFQAMSQAMAESCTGEVVILSERPETIHQAYSTLQPGKTEFQNIWGDRERPALLTLKNRRVVTDFYVVDARGYFGAGSSYPTVYDYDIRQDKITGESNRVFVPGVGKLVRRDELMNNETMRAEFDEMHRLAKRACDRDSGVASELAGYDYFAGFWPQDYP